MQEAHKNPSLYGKPISQRNSSVDLALDSPRQSKEKNYFVQNKKSKNSKKNQREKGFEYDLDVTTDNEYLEKIYQTGSYTATHEEMIDFVGDIERLIVTIILTV